MTIILDTGVFYAFFDKKDAHYLDSVAILTHSIDGRFGEPFTSDYVALEASILLQRRLGANVSLSFLDFLQESGVRTVAAGEENYKKAIEIFRANFPRLSICDAATVAMASGFGISALASYDHRSFAGLISEIIGTNYYESLGEKDQMELGRKLSKQH